MDATRPCLRSVIISYHREFFLLDVVRVTFALGGSSEDGSRYTLRNEF